MCHKFLRSYTERHFEHPICVSSGVSNNPSSQYRMAAIMVIIVTKNYELRCRNYLESHYM